MAIVDYGEVMVVVAVNVKTSVRRPLDENIPLL